MSPYHVLFKDETLCRMETAQGWADWGGPWLCAHDVFHHRPDDTGSLAHELMSFGAQLWLEHGTCSTRFGIHSGALTGVLTDDYEVHREMQRLILTADAPPCPPLPTPFVDRFRHVVELGLFEASREIDAYREEQALERLPDEAMSAFTSDTQHARYVGWMAYGYHLATQRFADPDAARTLCNRFAWWLRHCAQTGLPELRFVLDEARLLLRVHGAQAQALWEQAQSAAA